MVLCSCGLYFGFDSYLQLDIAKQSFTKLEDNRNQPWKAYEQYQPLRKTPVVFPQHPFD